MYKLRHARRIRPLLTSLLTCGVMLASSSVVALQDAAALSSVEVNDSLRWRMHLVAAPSMAVEAASLEGFDLNHESGFSDSSPGFVLKEAVLPSSSVAAIPNRRAKEDRLPVGGRMAHSLEHTGSIASASDGSTPRADILAATTPASHDSAPIEVAAVPVAPRLDPKQSAGPDGMTVAARGDANGDGREEISLQHRLVVAEDDLPRARRCLAEAVYFEARGEPENGQYAVAQVVMNRVRSQYYPDNVCGVVYQNKNWRNHCQFSFACDRIPDRIYNRQAWVTAQRIAHEVLDEGYYLPEVGTSTHYHATYVRPRWIRDMTKEAKIGKHIFYTVRNWTDEGV